MHDNGSDMIFKYDIIQLKQLEGAKCRPKCPG